MKGTKQRAELCKKKLAAKERRILANVSVDERKQVVDTKLRLRTKAKDAFPAAS